MGGDIEEEVQTISPTDDESAEQHSSSNTSSGPGSSLKYENRHSLSDGNHVPPIPLPHPINLPPNQPSSSRPRLGKYDPLPPLISGGKPLNEIQKSDDPKKRASFIEKKKHLYAHGLVKPIKKNLPLDFHKDLQNDKKLQNTTKRAIQPPNTSRTHYRQTYKLPPMEETFKDSEPQRDSILKQKEVIGPLKSIIEQQKEEIEKDINEGQSEVSPESQQDSQNEKVEEMNKENEESKDDQIEKQDQVENKENTPSAHEEEQEAPEVPKELITPSAEEAVTVDN